MGHRRISDHGFLADGRSGALVDGAGSVDWWCPGRFDSPSVFARLLDPDGGHWSIRPDDDFDVTSAYLDDTLVLRTTFTTGHGSVTLTDALALEPGARGHDIGRRSPQVLVRVLEGVSGTVPVTLSYRPRFEYGRLAAYLIGRDGVTSATAGPVRLDLRGSVPVAHHDGEATARFVLRAGQRHWFTLAYTPTYGPPPAVPPAGPEAVADTVEGWRSWSRLHDYRGGHADLVRRHALVVQGLTYQPSGAVVAAATTSLPERRGGDRNYDYRYAWLRDFALTLRALWVAACPDEANRLFVWMARAVGRLAGTGQPVPVVCGVEGERDLTERRVDTLRGYADSRPVWVGNDAWRQRQLDVPGEIVDAAWLLRDYLVPFHDEVRDLLRTMADQAAATWHRRDAGMWESRDEPRHHLSSKVFCWVALDRAVRFGPALGDPHDVRRWAAERDQVRDTVLRHGWNARVGAYTGAFGSDRLDSSVLVMPCVGFLDATDPRMRATIDLVERRLSHGGLLRRWEGEPAGFLLCSFWLVRCLALAGERSRAVALFESLAARAGPLGLYAEQVDLDTGEQLGNYPQAFSHLGLITAAWQLTETAPAAVGGG